MMTPAVAVTRFGIGLLLGAGLGVVYGFLRPLRLKWTHLADLLFVIVLFWAWLYLSFAVCRGDIRLAITAALGIGCVAWEATAGRLLQPVFLWFWRIIGGIFRFFTRPVEKMLKIFRKNAKKLLAKGKKWFTMRQSICTCKETLGGRPYAKAQKEKSPRRSAP